MNENEAIAQSLLDAKKQEGLNDEELKKKEKKIKKEINRLNKIFKKMDKNKYDLVRKLIEEVAFMSVTLEENRKYIQKNGVKELYMNGKGQFGYKESVESKNYNAMMKNYISTIKQLNDLLPEEEKINEEDGFDMFCDNA